MFKPLLGSSGHMSPTIYLNSVSYMMPVLVCSAGSPGSEPSFLRLSRLVPFQLAGNRTCLPNPTAWSSFRILWFSLHGAEDLEHPLLREDTGWRERTVSSQACWLVWSVFLKDHQEVRLHGFLWKPALATLDCLHELNRPCWEMGHST